jgi:hypothetical protein
MDQVNILKYYPLSLPRADNGDFMTLNMLHQIVGTTRSGKSIICANEFEKIEIICAYFEVILSKDDLLDALAVFEYLSIRAKRHEDVTAEIYEQHSRGIGRLLTSEDFDIAKSKAGIATAFDFRNLGQRLVRIEFKDS